MKRLLHLLALFLLVGLAFGQTATVKRNTNLRSDASSASDVVEKLKSRAQLQLVEPDPTSGYYHVTAPDGQDGWVWGRNISISQDTATVQPTPSPTPSGTPALTQPSSDADLYSLLFSVRTTAVGQPLIENQKEVCGAEGDATNQRMQALNDNKNRTDQPTKYVEMTWDQLKNLPKDRVNDFQGAAISVVGFLSHQVKVEKGSGESTNCHLTGDNEVDWHIYLTNLAAQPISQAIIVETTPRVRPLHKWSKSTLDPLVDSSTQVRISGWLMYDFEHENVIGTQRASVWEIHPITRIQIMNNGQWVDLDNQ
jgi:hypothetical protein